MSGIVIVTIDTNLPPDAFGQWMLGAFPHLPPEHIDMIRHDGFACYMDEMQGVLAHMTQQWADNVGNLFDLSFGMRPVFDVEKEDERHGGAQKVFITTRRRRMQTEAGNDPILRGLLDALGGNVKVMRLDGNDSPADLHNLLDSLFGEGRHEHKRRS